ncbi:DUF305 domain-containing protein [Brevundimonas sp.]|uniref:CopM family metallochaperone n=1 Tax=Brevundimonas sp. TaxID=1871086 RepID=UPI003AFF8140
MKTRLGLTSLVALLIAAAAFGFGWISRHPAVDLKAPAAVDARPLDPHAGHADAPTDSASTRSYRKASDQMHRDMAIDYSGDADLDFMRGMIAHHQGAIAMAKVEQEFGDDPDVRGLAGEIIAAQTAEIERMRIWLARRETSKPSAGKP